MPRRFRRYLPLLLALLVIAFGLYKLRKGIALEDFHWNVVAASLKHARISLMLLSLVAIYGCYALRSLRWMRFCRSLGSLHFGNVYKATLMGFTCLFLLGRPGEPIRPVLIAKKDSLPVVGMFGIFFLERISDIAATAVLAGVALALFQQGGLVNERTMHLLVFARSVGRALLYGLAVVIVLLIYFRLQGARLLTNFLRNPRWRTGWRERIVLRIEGFSEGLQAIRTWKDLSLLTAYTALHWILVAFVY